MRTFLAILSAVATFGAIMAVACGCVTISDIALWAMQYSVSSFGELVLGTIYALGWILAILSVFAMIALPSFAFLAVYHGGEIDD
jgi:hypothetical protein